MRVEEAPTIEELTELLDQDFGKCQAGMGIGIGRWGKWLWSCKAQAEHVIRFHCPEHGERHVRLCRGCMRFVRSARFGRLRCQECHRAGKWKTA